jgi:heptosyltransferase-3
MNSAGSALLQFAHPPQRVLVVVTRRIGDVLLTTPLLASIRSAWPSVVLDVLVFAGTAGAIAGLPMIDSVIEIAQRPRASEQAALMRRLWRRYDLAVSTIPGDRPTLYARVAGRRAIGVQIDGAKHLWKRRLLSASIGYDDLDTHAVVQNLRLADALGIARDYRVQVAASPVLAPAIEAELAKSPFVVIHPYPRFRYKMWHAEGFAAFAHWARAASLRVVLSASPAADELAYAQSLRGQLPQDTIDLSGRLSLAELAALLQRARLYLGPDTVVTHMAAALGVPTIALFGPSNPVRWGPWPARFAQDASPWPRVGSGRVGNVYLVQGAAACAPRVPCLLEGCDRHVGSDSACLTGLPTARVIEAAATLLEQSGRLADRPLPTSP